MYKIIETDFSIFKNKNKAMELFSQQDAINKIILIYYQTIDLVVVCEILPKGRYVAHIKVRDNYFALGFSSKLLDSYKII